MTQWQQILADSPELLDSSPTQHQLKALKQSAVAVPLTDRGAVEITGSDCNKLLQGQMTCDILNLAIGETLPGAMCDVKGRMISSFYAHRVAEEKILLVMHEGLTASTCATLKKYAVFYKAEVLDLSDQYLAIGLCRAATTPNFDDNHLLKISDSRQLLLCPAAQGQALWSSLLSSCKKAGLSYWEYLMIQEGEGEVRPETAEEFIPQMLNLQHTGAINFRKGCYTGQEIVARMQYLGKLKRRMYAVRIESSNLIKPGTVIDTDEKKSVGTVVMSQFSDSGQLDVLAVLTAEAADQSELVISGSARCFTLLPLPYDDKFVAAE